MNYDNDLGHRLGFWILYRYFRRGGIYRYDPNRRVKAFRLAWAYWKKSW